MPRELGQTDLAHGDWLTRGAHRSAARDVLESTTRGRVARRSPDEQARRPRDRDRKLARLFVCTRRCTAGRADRPDPGRPRLAYTTASPALRTRAPSRRARSSDGRGLCRADHGGAPGRAPQRRPRQLERRGSVVAI